jgi:TetR/AcrR family transcriptional repressor of nem operon
MAGTTGRDVWVAAAAEEFQQHGYTATGIAALAARAGAIKGSFYNYFVSKEALAIEVIAGYARDAKLELLQGDGPAGDRIRAHFTHLREELHRRGDAFGCLLGNFAAEAAADNEAIREVVRTCFTMWVEALAAAVDEARSAPDGAPSVPGSAAAELLIDAWEGALLRAKVQGNAEPVDTFMNFTLDYVLEL